jgi:DNA polymerase III delta prime subunit
MEKLDFNQILDREQTATEITTILSGFDENCKNLTFKKGIYIYGSPGCGKTEFVMRLLTQLNYDVIKYDAGDIRNKTLIDTITSNNISSKNVLLMMSKKVKKIAIVMDEIDGMNSGDRGGITALIKLIRQKKTKKQKLECMTMNPIICIGNYYMDKKIRELMKVCNVFELKTPTNPQIEQIIHLSISPINPTPTTAGDGIILTKDLVINILGYVQGDIRKLHFILDIYKKKPEYLNSETLQTIFHLKSYNEDSKKITQRLINNPAKLEDHNKYMNETDRTIVALLWHENIVDVLDKKPKEQAYPFYVKILNNICYADYIDRITFQNQIWQFNEMSSLMKTFYNNKIYHETFPENRNIFKPVEVRFTKVLTKYSTEYNNMLFIYNLCQELDMDKKDLIAFFQELRIFYGKDFCSHVDQLNFVEKIFEDYNISKLDIKRMYRYLDKNVKKDSVVITEEEEEEEEFEL